MFLIVKVKVNVCIAGSSKSIPQLAIWDHTVLPAT